jgi:hypothetical protein
MKIFDKILLASVMLIIVTPIIAQGAPPATPIDGGLSILLGAGAVYGAKKIFDGRKKD